MNDGGAQAGAIPSILLVNVLDDFLTPLMLEIDIDIGWLTALFGKKPVEQQLVLGGIDAGDAKAEANGGIGRAAAPLAQDRGRLATREIDDFLDGEEIGGEIELADQPQLILKRGFNFGRYHVGITPICTLPGLLFQILLRGHAVGISPLRVLVLQIFKAEGAGIRDIA